MIDTLWEKFIATIPDPYLAPDYKNLVEMVRDAEIAKAIYFHFGKYSENWLVSPCPALGNQLPKSFLNEDLRKSALRAVLMRIPC